MTNTMKLSFAAIALGLALAGPPALHAQEESVPAMPQVPGMQDPGRMMGGNMAEMMNMMRQMSQMMEQCNRMMLSTGDRQAPQNPNQR